MANLKKVVTIAGSDTSGGAGIQADLKTFQERGVYGMNVLTVIVTMDKNWNHKVFPIDMNTIKEQAQTVFEGIGVDGVKTGMLPTVEIIEYAGSLLKKCDSSVIKVVDPVMVCKGTDEVLFPENTIAMQKHLLPYATAVTPNLFEAAQLAGVAPIHSLDDLKEAAKKIYDLGPKNVVIKGGKALSDKISIDVVYNGKDFEIFECTFAASLTAELTKGKSVTEAMNITKKCITDALKESFKLNEYVGPVYHKAFSLK